MTTGSPFFDLYYALKAKFPGCAEQYYHRAIQEALEYECPHPFPLLRLGGAGGPYLIEHAKRYAWDMDQKKEIERWFQSVTDCACLWCPVCQTYPYWKRPRQAAPAA